METDYISILYPEKPEQALRTEEPACFQDLNLDQIFRPVLEDDRWQLKELYYTLPSEQAVSCYRREVFRDLENEELRSSLETYRKQAVQISAYARALFRDDMSLYDCGQLLRLCELYRSSALSLKDALERGAVQSEGLRKVHDHISVLCASDRMKQLEQDCAAVRAAFAPLRYTMVIRRNEIRFLRSEQPGFAAEAVEKLFARFADAETSSSLRKPDEIPVSSLNEEKILDSLSRLFPEQFEQLLEFADKYRGFDTSLARRLGQEIAYYTEWMRICAPLAQKGLPLALADFSDEAEQVLGCYDLALALASPKEIVQNGYELRSGEKIMAVSGPNNGGKTTFARCFGQLHYLAALGLPIPASYAVLHFSEKVLTHFETEDAADSGSGRLRDDLLRLKGMTDQASQHTAVVINEIFTSTTLQDALALGEKMLAHLLEKNAYGVLVTFLDELASYGGGVVSMMCRTADEPGHKRLYQIIRTAQTRETYAKELAASHGLSKETILRRIPHAS